MSTFLDYIGNYISLSTTLVQDLQGALQINSYTKGHILLNEGRVCHRLYFLEGGTARTFYYRDGKEITSWIYPEQLPFTSWSSFLSGEPSFEYIEILEEAIVHSITSTQLENLYGKHPSLERFGRRLVEEQLHFLDQFYKGYLFMTAREKYDLLHSIFPDVSLRVNLGHIASLLGVSQETLSRIRRQK
ncbi:MAG: Crp/Fnr family transcriptional regulator [Saprospiraceae bacterium]|nr:Crp/Fnr family transcriptional regulator [Saprospiraceae bacterium]